MPRKKRKNKESEKPQFLVDYDLPQGKCRRKFYRKLRRVKPLCRKSTRSVIVSNDPKVALTVHHMAASCGTSNLYKVKKEKKKKQSK